MTVISKYVQLKLPENSKAEKISNKIRWNNKHYTASPDFYTIGYAGRSISDFVHILTEHEIATLVDIRYSPVSRFKPDYNKSNLKKIVESHGIEYIHKSDWGVPKDIRSFSVGADNRDAIWKWYDEHVLPNIVKRNMDEFFNGMNHPVALMCVEFDPTECHRHRVFLGLAKIGLQGYDL